MIYNNKGRYYITTTETESYLFDPIDDLPAATQWFILSCAIPVEGSIGTSLANATIWKCFGIYRKSSCHYCELELHFQERMLARLDWCGYIYFENTGSIWRVERKAGK